MKNYLKTNWKKILISCLLTLAPMLVGLCLWNSLPDTMNVHWGVDGTADDTGSKAFVVFLIPAFLTALNLLCFLGTSLDKKSHNQNPKAVGIIFWIVPAISWAANGLIYADALGKSWSVTLVMPLLIGVLFLIIGNGMPKVTQNKTFGIKIFWTLYNEENWNKTHRFAGKLWVAGGFLCLLTVLLPTTAEAISLILILLAMVLIPVIYSYSIYRKHRKAGIEYKPQ